MRITKPIVNISKIIDNYNNIIVGFRGVLYDGLSFKKEAIDTLIELSKIGKNLILLTNSVMRVNDIVELLEENRVSSNIWSAIVSAGEVAHYRLKSKKGDFSSLGNIYYTIGAKSSSKLFEGLNYREAEEVHEADFLYMGEAKGPNETIEDYMNILEYGVNQSMPLLCIGNDSSSYMEGHVSLASGTIAEQYAIMGGHIVTVGKPKTDIVLYATEALGKEWKKETIIIGDSLSSDIKSANLLDVDSLLISKGIHVNFLGEGYIPDITKTKSLSANFESYPDFIISNLRW